MPRQPYDPRNPGPHTMSAKAYDPYKLVLDVVALLEDRGLAPISPEGGSTRVEAETAASQLLRAIGIMPGMAPEDALDLDGGARYNSRLHGD
jgi:hypothetical protein